MFKIVFKLVQQLNSFSDKTQRWKLGNNKMLENKEGVWKSDDLWIFKTKGDGMIYIENTSKAKVLGATSDGKSYNIMYQIQKNIDKFGK